MYRLTAIVTILDCVDQGTSLDTQSTPCRQLVLSQGSLGEGEREPIVTTAHTREPGDEANQTVLS